MLYLVGGASRAGKSTLARRLLLEKQVPYFPIDALMMGFANGWPQFGLDPDTSNFVRGEKLWPILRAMAVNIIEEAATHPSYLLEGDELLPGHVAELSHEYEGQIRACFTVNGSLRVQSLQLLQLPARLPARLALPVAGTEAAHR